MQIFTDLFYSISATNVVDMLIIAFLIYFVLAWVRGTRSFQILATLLAIGLFYLAASRLGLILTSVLFQYLWAAIIIVLVIVFQPEIREMLDRASPMRYLSGRNLAVVEPDVIEETVRAVAELARLRLGALIVFQRVDSVRNLMLKGKALELHLISGTGDREDRPYGALAFLWSNWQLKLISLAASIFLWFVVVGPRSSELGISVPIQYSNLPQGMEITGKWMDRIDVRVRGSEASLANLKSGSVRALVDLSQVVRGLNFFRISDKNLLVPPGIAITHIRPSDLTLNIAAASVKKVKVSPSVIGAIPLSMRVLVSPAEVQIRGIKTELQRVTSVVTDPINIAELVEKGKTTVAVSVQPQGVRIEGIDPLQVTVSLERTS